MLFLKFKITNKIDIPFNYVNVPVRKMFNNSFMRNAKKLFTPIESKTITNLTKPITHTENIKSQPPSVFITNKPNITNGNEQSHRNNPVVTIQQKNGPYYTRHPEIGVQYCNITGYNGNSSKIPNRQVFNSFTGKDLNGKQAEESVSIYDKLHEIENLDVNN